MSVLFCCVIFAAIRLPFTVYRSSHRIEGLMFLPLTISTFLVLDFGRMA